MGFADRSPIDGVPYDVRPPAADPGAGVSRLYQLRKADGTLYHVAQHGHGAECDCPAFVFDHDGRGTPCKHLAALRAVGLLAAE